MTQQIFYDRNNKSFVIVDKRVNQVSRVLAIITQENFDVQLKFIDGLFAWIDFVNEPKNKILPDYMLNLKVARRLNK